MANLASFREILAYSTNCLALAYKERTDKRHVSHYECMDLKSTITRTLIDEKKFTFSKFVSPSGRAVAQPGFLDQWANFACVRKKRWAKWARFL